VTVDPDVRLFAHASEDLEAKLVDVQEQRENDGGQVPLRIRWSLLQSPGMYPRRGDIVQTALIVDEPRFAGSPNMDLAPFSGLGQSRLRSAPPASTISCQH
jgi:hypothetical protein